MEKKTKRIDELLKELIKENIYETEDAIYCDLIFKGENKDKLKEWLNEKDDTISKGLEVLHILIKYMYGNMSGWSIDSFEIPDDELKIIKEWVNGK